MTNILLIGGGVDSVTLALDLHNQGIDFELLHVNYGQVAAQAEYSYILKLAEYLRKNLNTAKDTDIMACNPHKNKLIDGATYDNPYVLGRNYYLLSIAATFGDNIYLGLSEGRIFDCTEDFVNKMNAAWQGAFDGNKKIHAPYVNLAKRDLVKLGAQLSDKYFSFLLSCWVPQRVGENYEPCGVCTHCLELEAYSQGLK